MSQGRISRQEYESKTETFWKDKRVVAIDPLASGVADFPPGTIFTITRKFSGFSVKSERCKCCGISLRITRVSPYKLALIED